MVSGLSDIRVLKESTEHLKLDLVTLSLVQTYSPQINPFLNRNNEPQWNSCSYSSQITNFPSKCIITLPSLSVTTFSTCGIRLNLST